MWSWRSLLGWGLLGWGIFDLVEGTVDHHILQIHHVRPGPDQLAYDLGFLVVGATLVVVGLLIALTDKPSEDIPNEEAAGTRKPQRPLREVVNPELRSSVKSASAARE